MTTEQELTLIGAFLAVFYVAGVLASVDAIMRVRTAQGAVAWAISLVTFPYLALPLYLIFGRRKFSGYIQARRSGDHEIHRVTNSLTDNFGPTGKTAVEERYASYRVLERLAKMPFTRSNSAELLIDGESTFRAIFAGLDVAQNYILAQFYIVNDDGLGRQFKEKLVSRAKAGVRVYLLYDEIGSHGLPRAYLDELQQAGVEVSAFNSTRGRRNRLQLNFRNHRKIVIVDGRLAYVGGLNVGDEYLGKDARFGPWRDSHVKIEGPAVQCVQLSFSEDWYWATHRIPELNWEPQAASDGDKIVLVLPTGPADEIETCSLFFLQAINSARNRLWIASPYFVPDPPVIAALQLAALKGVDVRIMIPEKPDHLLVYLSSFSYLHDARQAGVNIYRYQPGFLHQKVVLVDDIGAAVGTANLDNRSFRLNFEIMVLFADTAFAAEVEKMLEQDFGKCRRIDASEFENRPVWFRLAVRVARLMAPIQ